MESLQPWFDAAAGERLPLPPALAAFHGPLQLPRLPDRPYVCANFVESLDGVVAVDPPRGSGADISGRNAQDRALMGLLRAAVDAVVVGAGNLRAGERGRAPAASTAPATPAQICPELGEAYAQLRAAMGKRGPPLQVVVSGSGRLDLGLAIFSGAVPAVVVAARHGAERLRAEGCPVPVVVAPEREGHVPLAAVLAAAGLGPATRVLLEAGPTTTTWFIGEGMVDELFLTVAPILVGHAGKIPTLALVEGRVFPSAVRGRLLSARRGESVLFLRYALGSAALEERLSSG